MDWTAEKTTAGTLVYKKKQPFSALNLVPKLGQFEGKTMSLATLSVTAGLKNNYKISLLAVCLYCTSLYIIIFVISVEPSHPLTYAKGIAVKFFIYF